MQTDLSERLTDEERLAALRSAGLVDGAPDPAFDQLTRLVTRFVDAPVALVSVVGRNGQRFLGCVTVTAKWIGLEGTPLSHSFCKHAVVSGEPLVVEDARTHPELRDNPAIDELGIVAYAGIPLVTSENQVLGTVCVIDHEPRQWAEDDLTVLREIAELAIGRIELRAEVRKRRAAEEELRSRADQYRALVENMDEVITVLDKTGTIRYESSSVERILGHRPDDLVGTDVFEGVHPDDRPAVREAMAELLEEPGSTRIGEVRFQDARGDYRWLEYIAQNLLHVPAVEGIVVNSRDVSELRALERSARQAEKLDALGRLAGGVAHDFNNILGVIGTNAELVLEDLPEDSPVRGDLREVVSSVERGARLTRQLLDFSRTKSADREVLDPAEQLRDMSGILRRLVSGDVELHLEAEDDVPPVRIARSELEQVILNLVVNARDAIDGAGTVKVRVGGPEALPDNTIPVSERDRGSYVTLTVADTGEGIPEDRKGRIFEPFFTTKPEGEGTGLGLSTVYGVVVRNGGRIGLESTVGEGTTFSVFLPVHG